LINLQIDLLREHIPELPFLRETESGISTAPISINKLENGSTGYKSGKSKNSSGIRVQIAKRTQGLPGNDGQSAAAESFIQCFKSFTGPQKQAIVYLVLVNVLVWCRNANSGEPLEKEAPLGKSPWNISPSDSNTIKRDHRGLNAM